ncbi:MAG: potassium transporter Kup [Vicinamibacterales bacterium]
MPSTGNGRPTTPAAPAAHTSTAPHAAPPTNRYLLTQSLVALGVVYGDIGTSPLYAFRECFNEAHGLAVTPANVLGVLSLIFWSLIIVISIKYLAYVTKADNGGEGGILALTALAHPVAKGRMHGTVLLVGLFGAALLYGDGIITPAISVLGAIEGLEVAAPGLDAFVVPAALVILAVLFWFQRRGTAGVGAVFGPVTLVWFAALTVLGLVQIAAAPEVLRAVNPWHAVVFLATNHWTGFLVLGAVFLVVTGGEALYADMGHFGRRPIVLTWFVVVLPALLVNYFGQGALLIHTPGAVSNPFYRMAPAWALYPLLVLATLAAIIASQAVISGAFSLSRQAAMLGYLPRMKIAHTSAREIGQVYVPGVNTGLFLCTIALVLAFESSSNLAAAYGIAVTITMVITTLLAYWVARHRWGWSQLAAVGLTTAFLVVDLAFFGANIIKIEDGGWVPLVVAAAVFTVMTTWKRGRQQLGARMRARTLPLKEFFERMRHESPARVPGTAVFMTGNPEGTPPALLQNFIHNRVVHEQVVLLTIVTEESARVRNRDRVEVTDLGHGFVRVVAHYGFMEEPDIPALLARRDLPTPGIDQATFFLGRETLLSTEQSDMPRWRTRLFALMARNAAQATSFFRIPPDRVFEVGSHIEL